MMAARYTLNDLEPTGGIINAMYLKYQLFCQL